MIYKLTVILSFSSSAFLNKYDTINLSTLLSEFPLLGQSLLESPQQIIPKLIKAKQQLKIVSLPFGCDGIHFFTLPPLEATGQLISFAGTVVRSGNVKVAQKSSQFQCLSCKSITISYYDDSAYGTIAKPDCCSNLREEKGICGSTRFVSLSNQNNPTISLQKEECFDYQEIKIQELITKIPVGTIPKTIIVVLKDDLVDCCKPGDCVLVIGCLINRWKPLSEGKRCQVQTILVAYNLLPFSDGTGVVSGQSPGSSYANSPISSFREQCELFWDKYQEDKLKARSILVKSFCPHVYGLDSVKLGLLLALVGGNQKEINGVKIRSDSHVLLAGDPGTAKSQLLKYVHSVGIRSVLTCGIGTTSAGLTAAAIKDGPDWALEAGALVLADNGICCIDEFSSINEADKTTIHEAMEQQTISIAKAGIVCKLNTRCPIIAACNLSSKHLHTNSPLSEALNIASPLLSRFDLVFVLLDKKDAILDERIADFLLSKDCNSINDLTASSELWPLQRLQSYIAYIKYNCCPIMTDTCSKILQAYYCLQRKSDYTGLARNTIRMLESLIRIAEAHAKLLFKEEVDEMDAIFSIKLMEESLLVQPILGFRKGLYHVENIQELETEYLVMKEIVKKRLLND